MKKIKSILGLILFFMIVLTVPVFADSGKINSINYNILITEESKLEIISSLGTIFSSKGFNIPFKNKEAS